MTFDFASDCDGGAAPTERTMTAAGISWRYLEWGSYVAPFVLWHGITSDAYGWWRVGPRLASMGFHVFAPDLPGHGLSGNAPGGYAVHNTAGLLDQWLAALALHEPIILGHSWGGMNALVHASLPDAQVRSRALVLLDPAVALASDPARNVAYFTAGLDTPPDDAARAEIAAANPGWHPCDVWWKAWARHRARRAAVEGFLVENAGQSFVDNLGQLAQPTAVILGDPARGGIWSLQQIELLPQVAPRLALDVVFGSSHNVHRDSFDAFMAALQRFLADL